MEFGVSHVPISRSLSLLNKPTPSNWFLIQLFSYASLTIYTQRNKIIIISFLSFFSSLYIYTCVCVYMFEYVCRTRHWMWTLVVFRCSKNMSKFLRHLWAFLSSSLSISLSPWLKWGALQVYATQSNADIVTTLTLISNATPYPPPEKKTHYRPLLTRIIEHIHRNGLLRSTLTW